MKNISKSSRETSLIAKKLATKIIKTNKKSCVLGLIGELGAGKTTFVKSFSKTLGVKGKILSPTFVIQKSFALPKKSKFQKLYHIDAYRILSKDIVALGFRNLIKGENIIIVEWADRIKKVMPKETFWITLSHGKNKNERHIAFNRR